MNSLAIYCLAVLSASAVLVTDVSAAEARPPRPLKLGSDLKSGSSEALLVPRDVSMTASVETASDVKFRHIVLHTFKEDITESQKQVFMDALRKLPSCCPEVGAKSRMQWQ